MIDQTAKKYDYELVELLNSEYESIVKQLTELEQKKADVSHWWHVIPLMKRYSKKARFDRLSNYRDQLQWARDTLYAAAIAVDQAIHQGDPAKIEEKLAAYYQDYQNQIKTLATTQLKGLLTGKLRFLGSSGQSTIEKSIKRLKQSHWNDVITNLVNILGFKVSHIDQDLLPSYQDNTETQKKFNHLDKTTTAVQSPKAELNKQEVESKELEMVDGTDTKPLITAESKVLIASSDTQVLTLPTRIQLLKNWIYTLKNILLNKHEESLSDETQTEIGSFILTIKSKVQILKSKKDEQQVSHANQLSANEILSGTNDPNLSIEINELLKQINVLAEQLTGKEVVIEHLIKEDLTKDEANSSSKTKLDKIGKVVESLVKVLHKKQTIIVEHEAAINQLSQQISLNDNQITLKSHEIEKQIEENNKLQAKAEELEKQVAQLKSQIQVLQNSNDGKNLENVDELPSSKPLPTYTNEELEPKILLGYCKTFFEDLRQLQVSEDNGGEIVAKTLKLMIFAEACSNNVQNSASELISQKMGDGKGTYKKEILKYLASHFRKIKLEYYRNNQSVELTNANLLQSLKSEFKYIFNATALIYGYDFKDLLDTMKNNNITIYEYFCNSTDDKNFLVKVCKFNRDTNLFNMNDEIKQEETKQTIAGNFSLFATQHKKMAQESSQMLYATAKNQHYSS